MVDLDSLLKRGIPRTEGCATGSVPMIFSIRLIDRKKSGPRCRISGVLPECV